MLLFFAFVIGVIDFVEPAFGAANAAEFSAKTGSSLIIIPIHVSYPTHHVEIPGTDLVSGYPEYFSRQDALAPKPGRKWTARKAECEKRCSNYRPVPRTGGAWEAALVGSKRQCSVHPKYLHDFRPH